VIELYHERWELEVGYDEFKTHMLERKESLRSLKPEGIAQELWGFLLTYYPGNRGKRAQPPPD
jgi:hypothetical protein